MKELNIGLHYASKILITIETMFAHASGVFLLIPMVAIATLSSAERAAIFLLFLFIADFVTGIAASWVEFKAAKPLVPASGKRYLIQSAKLRLSGIKFVCYALGLLCAYGIEIVFVVKKFNPSMITTEDLTFTTIITAFFCAIELYSIFFENVKRMGFDLIAKFNKVLGLAKRTKSKITNL